LQLSEHALGMATLKGRPTVTLKFLNIKSGLILQSKIKDAILSVGAVSRRRLTVHDSAQVSDANRSWILPKAYMRVQVCNLNPPLVGF